jgi:hypothetical protein
MIKEWALHGAERRGLLLSAVTRGLRQRVQLVFRKS